MTNEEERPTAIPETPPANESGDKTVSLPATLFFGWVVRFFLVGNMALVWLGYWYLYGQWPGTFKLCLCTAMGIIGLIWAVTAWRASAIWHKAVIRSKPRPVPVYIPAIYAAVLIGIILLESIFMTWVTCGPPQIGG